jgi:DNA-binding PadR family transcriptional regulator
MEERLKNLKRSMKSTTFGQLKFTQITINEVHKKIRQQEIREEDIILAVMQLLVYEKTGYELTKKLRGRGIRKFEDNEGFLYTVLHELEHKGYLTSNWDGKNEKLYILTNKGKKILKKEEKRCTSRAVIDTLTEVSQS